MAIYIITHKKTTKYGDGNYKLLYVGAALRIERFGEDFLTDSVRENISVKNKSFCELTGIYWIWKNSCDDIVGFVHYRRYLLEPGSRDVPVRYDTVRNLLNDKDIILPKISKQPNSIKYGWSLIHYIQDLDMLRNVIEEKCPDYLEDFDVFMSSHELYICNIMIGKKEIVDKYCEWLFELLFELEKRVDISDYDTMQKRLFGFLSERLLNVWVRHNNLRIAELRLYNTETKKKSKITSKLYDIARYCFYIDILYFQVYRKLKFYHGE